MKRKLTVFISVILLFVTTAILTEVNVDAAMEPPEIETITIQEFTEPYKKRFTMQSTPESVIEVLNFVEKSTDRQTNQLLKYVYPTYSDTQLKSVSANLEQTNKYLLNQNYKTKIVKGVLDIAQLKEELSKGRPVIAYLTANGDYWIEQETAVIIFGYQKIKFPNRPEMISYTYKSINHGKGAIYNGSENEIYLLLNEGIIDPSANVTFKWDSTLYGFNK